MIKVTVTSKSHPEYGQIEFSGTRDCIEYLKRHWRYENKDYHVVSEEEE